MLVRRRWSHFPAVGSGYGNEIKTDRVTEPSSFPLAEGSREETFGRLLKGVRRLWIYMINRR